MVQYDGSVKCESGVAVGQHDWRSAKEYVDWYFEVGENGRPAEWARIASKCYGRYGLTDGIFVRMRQAGAAVTRLRGGGGDEEDERVAYGMYAVVMNELERESVVLFAREARVD